MNVFLGARRLLYTLMIIIGCGFAYDGYRGYKTPIVYFDVYIPDSKFIQTEKCEFSVGTSKNKLTSNGLSYIVHLCSKELSDAVIKSSVNDMLGGSSKPSDQELSRSMFRAQYMADNFDSIYKGGIEGKVLWENVKYFFRALAKLILAVFVLWLVAFATGWIIRGFLGIPMWKDRKQPMI